MQPKQRFHKFERGKTPKPSPSQFHPKKHLKPFLLRASTFSTSGASQHNISTSEFLQSAAATATAAMASSSCWRMAGTEVPLLSTDSIEWRQVSVPSTPTSAANNDTGHTIAKDFASSCAIGSPPSHFIWYCNEISSSLPLCFSCVAICCDPHTIVSAVSYLPSNFSISIFQQEQNVII